MADKVSKSKGKRRIIQPSSWSFFREGLKTPGYNLFDWLHGYVYGRWPYLYIGIGTGEHHLAKPFGRVINFLNRLFPKKSSFKDSGETLVVGIPADLPYRDQNEDTFADGYHGKVVPLSAARELVTIGKEIRLTDLEQVIPYTRARDIILKNPDHIVVLDCPCRSSRPNPCLPLDVCLVIGEPFASFVQEHHPQRSRWISSDQAVEILEAENSRGHVHHAFFKDAMLGRFYAICNCCACCCGAMQAHQNGTPMLASSGYISKLEEDLCSGCGTCVETCQFQALSLEDNLAVVDASVCMGCGVCVSQCSEGALSLQRDPQKGEPLEIQVLMANATEFSTQHLG
jgi:ferredoxin